MVFSFLLSQNAKRPPLPASLAIRVDQATVAYRSYKERPTSLKESLLRIIRQRQLRHYSTFDALSQVTFNVPRGSVFGIIGSNGSGKSTLLKVLAQVLLPTRGYAQLEGTVSSLIELGAGFDPELSAVENIYLNGSLHRRSRAQIKARLDAVLDFAELHDFANTPIKYFSSGMYARLGFAVAIDIDPDILLVDEILAVGDERFQQKCLAVFDRLTLAGKTIVIVSHNMELLEQRAQQIALLSKGRLVFLGDPKRAITLYRDKSYETALVS